MAPGYSMANTIGISTKAPGQVLDRFLPATAASLASAAQ
jgi:hypothetical protein